MGWLKDFFTKSPETGETTRARVKVDDSGAVTDMIYGLEKDSPGVRRHGHVWGLAPMSDDSGIGGRDISHPFTDDS